MYSTRAPHLTESPGQNLILASLPRDEYERLLPELEFVRLPQGRVLWRTGDRITHAFFLQYGMVSLLSTTGEGSSVEVGMMGNEAVAGVASILRMDTAPYDSVVQVAAAAMRIRVEALRREFARGGRLQHLMLRFTHSLMMQLAQSAACNRFHTAEERLCRWLLTSRDRARSDTLHLTHEFLAQMIGVPRTNVSMIASRLQRMGYIRYRRGAIEILDRRGLENFSCECYRAITDEITRYLAA